MWREDIGQWKNERGVGMSLIKRGRKRASITAFAVSLVGYMALSAVGAPSASALSSCTFGGGSLNVVQASGEFNTFSLNASGDILIDGLDTTNAPCSTTRAMISNTTSINVTGFTGDEGTTIQMYEFGGDDLVSWGTINWNVQGATGTADEISVDGSGLTDATPDNLDVALGANGIDLNNDGDNDVTLGGVEEAFVDGGNGNDTIWAAGSTATGAAFTVNLTATGGSGNDTLASGAVDDDLDGGANTATGDTIDFSGALAAVNINLTGGVATGMGSDVLFAFENVVGSGFNDTIIGSGLDDFITGGAGDDTIDGEAGFDYIDYSDAPGAVTVDMNLGTATGNGNDTFSDIEGVQGGDGDDKIIDDQDIDNDYLGGGGNDTFDQGATELNDSDTVDGEGGIDTADYSARTAALDGDLTGGCSGGTGECDEYDNVENVRLGSGDDSWFGSEFNNIFFPGGGQNALNGEDGIDSLNYSYGYTAGVTINMAGGGQSGGGEDSISEFENATGTAFNDTMIGTDVVAGTNGANLLVGGKGSDNISANAGPDSVRAGAGNDRIRGGAGDDTLEGQGGKDNIRGSGGADDIFGGKGKDFCNGGGGNDFIKTCEKPKHNGHGPNGPGLHQRI
jgi:hypothetical protein